MLNVQDHAKHIDETIIEMGRGGGYIECRKKWYFIPCQPNTSSTLHKAQIKLD